MNFLLNLSDYVFYRGYSFAVGKTDSPSTYGSGIVSVMQAILFIDIYDSIALLFSLAPLNKIYFILVALAIMIFNWSRYEKDSRYDECRAKWSNERQPNKIISGWAIVIAITLLFVVLFIV